MPNTPKQPRSPVPLLDAKIENMRAMVDVLEYGFGAGLPLSEDRVDRTARAIRDRIRRAETDDMTYAVLESAKKEIQAWVETKTPEQVDGALRSLRLAAPEVETEHVVVFVRALETLGKYTGWGDDQSVAGAWS